MSPLERIEKALTEIEWMDGKGAYRWKSLRVEGLVNAFRELLEWEIPEHLRVEHIVELQKRLADKLEGK